MRVPVKSKSFSSRVSVCGYWTTSVSRPKTEVAFFLFAKRDTREKGKKRDKERVFQSQKTKRVITWEKREPSRLGREPFSSDPLELVSWFVPIFFSLLFPMFFVFLAITPFLSFVCVRLDCLRIWGFWIGSDDGVWFFLLVYFEKKNWFFFFLVGISDRACGVGGIYI